MAQVVRRQELRPLPVKAAELGDLRFRKLLDAKAWASLPPAVKARFSKRLAGGATAIYVGEVRAVEISWLGRLLGQVLRLIGAPLPLWRDVGVPTIVCVTEDARSGGQIWSRTYCNRSGFPQVIHSTKQFMGSTGLEEHLGFGIAMALAVKADETGLTFTSAGYALQLGRWRVCLPRFLSPGQVSVRHRALADDRFEFSLDVVHPLFGTLIHQVATYHDT